MIAPSLTEIFTKSLYTGIFPNEWKEARVSPVHKNGAKHEPSNYRPISVIPTVSKNFEKNVFDQLNKYYNDKNLLTSCQSGFRSLHSTMAALLEATNSRSVNIDNGLVNGVVFIDLKKAFDTIDHQIILQKQGNYGIDHSSLKWFKSYLTGRTQKCTVINSELESLKTWLITNKLKERCHISRICFSHNRRESVGPMFSSLESKMAPSKEGKHGGKRDNSGRKKEKK